ENVQKELRMLDLSPVELKTLASPKTENRISAEMEMALRVQNQATKAGLRLYSALDPEARKSLWQGKEVHLDTSSSDPKWRLPKDWPTKREQFQQYLKQRPSAHIQIP